jgi:hypothetical protein
MTWNVFRGKLKFSGTEYHGKAAEFDKIIGLPRHLGLPFRLALGGTEAPVARLEREGWAVYVGPAVTLTPQNYREYIAASRGEVSVAKNVYVALGTAWFSCRSACYLAAARPVVVQDTGFSRLIPTGIGLHAFTMPKRRQRQSARSSATMHVRRASRESWPAPISTRGKS